MVFERGAVVEVARAGCCRAFGIGLGALLLTVLAWPVSALVRRHYGVPYALQGRDARAHRLVRIAALAVAGW